jgi:hypothetical protein
MDPDLDPNPDPAINSKKKVRKPRFLYFLLLFISLKTDPSEPSKSNKQITLKTNFFCHLVSHRRKKQDPDPDLDPDK